MEERAIGSVTSRLWLYTSGWLESLGQPLSLADYCCLLCLSDRVEERLEKSAEVSKEGAARYRALPLMPMLMLMEIYCGSARRSGGRGVLVSSRVVSCRRQASPLCTCHDACSTASCSFPGWAAAGCPRLTCDCSSGLHIVLGVEQTRVPSQSRSRSRGISLRRLALAYQSASPSQAATFVPRASGDSASGGGVRAANSLSRGSRVCGYVSQ